MNYNKIIISMFLIIITLILLILYYRNYVYQYCKNDMKCAKEKLILNLDNLITTLKIKYFDINNKIQKKESKNKKIDEETKQMGEEEEENNFKINEEDISTNNINNKTRNYHNIISEETEYYENGDIVEGFFGGLGSWFPSSTSSKAPVLPGTFPD